MTILGLAVLWGALTAQPGFPPPLDARLEGFVALEPSKRRELLKDLPREEIARALADTPADRLLRLGREGLSRLGIYRIRLVKEERVGGDLLGPQTIDVTVRETPFAVRGEVIAGPSQGRRFLYDARSRPDQIRAREAGLLGVVAVWVGIDSSLTRRDTNHRITDLGLGGMLAHLERDDAAAKPFGGERRKDEGFGAAGAYCLTFEAPPGATGLYARRARLCIDPADGILRSIDVWDAKGLLERYRFELVGARLSPPPDFFSADSF